MKMFQYIAVVAGLVGVWGGFLHMADQGEFESAGVALDGEYYTNDGRVSAASRTHFDSRIALAHALGKPPGEMRKRSTANPAESVHRIGKRQFKVSGCALLDPGAPSDLTRSRILETVREVALRYRIEEELLLAVMTVESGCRQNALSPKGAVGLMQVMPATARSLNVGNPHTATGNLHAGGKYLSELRKQFGKTHLALAAYNAGPAAVQRYSGIPPYRETQRYTAQVLETYHRLRVERARRGQALTKT